jgi:octaprenyl-diphosphate synthase
VAPQLAPVALATIQQPVKTELEAVFDRLGLIIESDFQMIADVNAHLLRIRGKLFRPTIVLLSAKATTDLEERHVPLAAVVELIHLATLIHDDSVDHSVLRRGQPTVNSLFSHQIAVIMGDYLYSRAIVELVKLNDLDPLRVMSRVTNEMTVGEMREIEAHDVLDFTAAQYDRLIDAKTASLMSGAAEVGAVGAPPAQRAALKRYGRALGMAFQIADDVLDYMGAEELIGKPTALDLREHKITLPLIAALPEMNAPERATVVELMRNPAPSDEHIQAVMEAVARRGGIEAALARALEFANAAHAELEHLPPSKARDALGDAIAYVVDRQS